MLLSYFLTVNSHYIGTFIVVPDIKNHETMKSILPIVVACALTVLAAGCSPKSGSAPSRTHLQEMNLKGSVETMLVISYQALEQEGRLTKGQPLDYAQTNRLCKFNRAGFVTEVDWLVDGDVAAWEEYIYDADRLEKIIQHSVVFGGDNTVKVEWQSDSDYTRNTYDEHGELVRKEEFTMNGEYSEKTITNDGSARIVIKTWYKAGIPQRSKSHSTDYAAAMEYEYNVAGDETAMNNNMDGKPYGRVEFEYTAYDDNGNWTGRVMYGTDNDGNRAPFAIEERTITYY